MTGVDWRGSRSWQRTTFRCASARTGGAPEALTELALGVLAPGGRLVMASCSSRVGAPDFFATINRAAAQAGRPLREIDRTGHAIDHPIRFPEGAYLKCLFASAP